MLRVKTFSAPRHQYTGPCRVTQIRPACSRQACRAQAQQESERQSTSEIGKLGLLASTALVSSLLAHPASAQVLDAAQVHQLGDFLRPTFTLFTFLYIVRIPLTWYPTIDGKAFPWNLAVIPTEPILAVTRKIVPLVGGVDVTPIVWVGLLSFLSEILLGPQGLLVLIERQGGL